MKQKRKKRGLIKDNRKNKKEGQKGKNRPWFILLRYIILLILLLCSFLVYKLLSPLTVYCSAYLLKLFYNVSVHKNFIIINNSLFIEIISACVAGAAYLLLLILNLSVPMNPKKRVYSILFSILVLFVLNIIRVAFLSVLLMSNFIFFDIAHKIFWYALSTLFVVGIWFLSVRIFSIKEIPVYSDLKYMVGLVKNSGINSP
jgi:exosortase/archaeosortase family protein